MRYLLSIAVGLAALALAWRFTPLAEVATAHSVMGWARALGAAWWAPVIIVIAYTPACLIMFPRPLITLAAVMAFGAWLGLLYAMSGILVAALATYFAGRGLRRDTVRRLAGSKLDGIENALRQRGLLAVIVVRLLPVAPFAVVGMVAGVLRVKLWHYALGTLLGMVPGALAATAFGNQIAAALDRATGLDWKIVGAVVACVALGALAVRKGFARFASNPSAQDPATSRSGPESPARGHCR
jgi:uncharacterized membrane protein YdjX (TVP38/TMEM64 family)